MNPSPEAVEKIRAQKIDWEQDNGTIADSLNAPSVPNPAAQGQVPVASGSRDFLLALAPETRPAAINWIHMPEVRRDIQAGNIGALLEWPDSLLIAGVITMADHKALMDLLERKQPDPTWQAQIPWSVAKLGRIVDEGDIQAAREAGE